MAKTIIAVASVAVALLVGGALWSKGIAGSDPSALSRGGIHWHPELAIFVRGERMEIPPNVGVGPAFSGMPGYDPTMGMAAIHTHEDLPLIHLEFMDGPVRKSDVALGRFFAVWGKDMRSFGENMTMTVNGAENTEYENYVMRDGDKIELHYD